MNYNKVKVILGSALSVGLYILSFTGKNKTVKIDKFKRSQPYGPNSSLRKKIWVKPFWRNI